MGIIYNGTEIVPDIKIYKGIKVNEIYPENIPKGYSTTSLQIIRFTSAPSINSIFKLIIYGGFYITNAYSASTCTINFYPNNRQYPLLTTIEIQYDLDSHNGDYTKLYRFDPIEIINTYSGSDFGFDGIYITYKFNSDSNAHIAYFSLGSTYKFNQVNYARVIVF